MSRSTSQTAARSLEGIAMPCTDPKFGWLVSSSSAFHNLKAQTGTRLEDHQLEASKLRILGQLKF